MAKRFYLQNATADYTPATLRGSWHISNTNASKMGDKAGASATDVITKNNATNPRDCLFRRFVSDPMLQTGDLSGTIQWIAAVVESSNSMNAYYKVYAYVTQGDSDTPRGVIYDNAFSSTEFTTTATGRGEGAVNLTTVTCVAGDRVVVEIGFRGNNTATTYTATLRRGATGATDLVQGNTAGVTTNPGWIELSDPNNLWSGPPTVNAGADASVGFGDVFSRTATEDLNGGTATARSWTIQSGPTGVGNTIGSAAALSWTPTAMGDYTLRYSLTTNVGTCTDDVIVTVTAPQVGVRAEVGIATVDNVSTVAVPKPTSAVEGDYLLCLIAQDSDGTIASMNPGSTGFSQIGGDGTSVNASGIGKVYGKFAGAGEPANYTFNIGLGSSTACVMIALTNVDPNAPIDAALVWGSGSGTSHSAPSIDTVRDGAMMIAGYIGLSAGTFYSTTDMTEVGEADTSWCIAMLAKEARPTHGTTGAQAATGPSCNYRSFSVAVAPKPIGGALASSIPLPTVAIPGVETETGAFSASVPLATSAIAGTLPYPLIETYTNAFDSLTGLTLYGSPSPSIVSGQVSLACTSAYTGVDEDAHFRLIGSSVVVEAPQVPPVGNGSTQCGLSIYSDISGQRDSVQLSWYNGFLGGLKYDNGVQSEIASVAYNATNHRWWRIRESGGTIYFEAGPDGINWPTAVASASAASMQLNPNDIIRIELYCGYWGSETAPTGALFDNLNLPPTGYSGALASSIPMPTAAVPGVVSETGALDAGIPLQTSAIPGVETETGALAATTPLPASTIPGTVTDTGALDASVLVPTSAILGDVIWLGALASAIPVATAAVPGVVAETGALDTSIPLPTSVLPGAVIETGALAASTPMVALTSDGDITQPQASGAVASGIPMPTATVAATVTDSGALDSAIPQQTVVVPGVVTETGALAGAVPLPTSAVPGVVSETGALAANLPMQGVQLPAGVIGTGTLAASTPTQTSAIPGVVRETGALAANGLLPTVVVPGTVTDSGALAAPIPAATATVPGVVSGTGALASSIPLPIVSVVEEITATGPLAAGIPLATTTIAGVETETGAVAAVVPMPTLASDTIVRETGAFAAGIPLPRAVSAAVVQDSGAFAAELPLPSVVISGNNRNTGPLAATIPMPLAESAAGVTDPGALAAGLPRPIVTVAGVVEDSGAFGAEIPIATMFMKTGMGIVLDLPLRLGASTDVVWSAGEPTGEVWAAGEPVGVVWKAGEPV